jgi:hypothetical protein
MSYLDFVSIEPIEIPIKNATEIPNAIAGWLNIPNRPAKNNLIRAGIIKATTAIPTTITKM